MLSTLLLTLLFIGGQKVIYVDGGVSTQGTYKSVTVQAIVFYDESKTIKMIVLDLPESFPPTPTPDPSPPPPRPDLGKYGVILIVIDNVLDSKRVTKAQTSALAKGYRDACTHITPGMSKADAQSIIVHTTRATLGDDILNWAPILDVLAAHMKSISNKLSTSKELTEYYLEVCTGLEACAKQLN